MSPICHYPRRRNENRYGLTQVHYGWSSGAWTDAGTYAATGEYDNMCAMGVVMGKEVKTDCSINAQIDGNQISVNAPSSGTLIDWRATQGSQLRKDAAVGRIQMQGGFVQPQMVIRAPADGVVAVDNGVEGAYVTAGTQLAVAYDGSQIYVTARVDETDINEVRTGQVVDIAVDAFPDADLTGRVVEVQSGAAGVFSLFPQANTSGNFQKVTQVIPVKIGIDHLMDLPLVPGMNVTVKIHRD